MKTANYLGVTTSTGDLAKYPLSVETLDFIQEQIKELHKIIKSVIGIDDGDYLIYSNESYPVICDSGELIPSKHNIKGINDYLKIEENTQNITADGITYFNARTRKDLIFSDNGTSDFSPFEDYQQIRTIREIDDELTEIRNLSKVDIKTKIDILETSINNLKVEVDRLYQEYIQNHQSQINELSLDLKRLSSRVLDLELNTGNWYDELDTR